MAARIRKGDRVVVITGADKGKQGEVLVVKPKENRAIVQGVNVAKKHVKPQGMGKPRWHHRAGGDHPPVQCDAGGSEDEQADAGGLPGAGRWPQGPRRPVHRRRDRGLRR